jgi:hypothetical protein
MSTSVNYDEIFKSLSKTLDVDVMPILADLNKNLDCDEIRPDTFASIMCGDCKTIPKIESMPKPFDDDDYYSSTDEESDGESDSDLYSSTGEQAKRSSEKAMKQKAFARPFHEIFEVSILKLIII